MGFSARSGLLLLAAASTPGIFRTVPLHAVQQQNQPEEALPGLLRLYESNPADWRVCHQLGLAYTRLQQLDQAAVFYRKAVALNGEFLPAKKNLATVLWFLGRKQESERDFRSIAGKFPEDPVPHLYLGLAEFERKDYPKAKLHFLKAGDLAFNNPEVLPAVAETYLATQSPIPAHVLKSIEQSAAMSPSKPAVYLLLAEAYDRQRMPKEAYNAYSKAIESDPRSEQGYLALANFASAHQNNDFALKVLDQGLATLPDSPRLLLHKGVICALQGNQGQAQESLLQAGKADPKWNVPLLALGVTQLEAGQHTGAAAAFLQAAKINSNDSRAWYLYATALTRAGAPGQDKEIVSALQKAIVLNPNDPRPRASLGQAYLKTGKVEEAAAELEKALTMDPENATALYQLGLLYRRQGKTAESQRLLQRFEKVKAKRTEAESELVEILKIVK